jgi:transmembrane sensor
MQQEDLKQLLSRYQAGLATDDEKALLESWYLDHDDNYKPEYSAADRIKDADSVWASLQSPGTGRRSMKLWPSIISIAAVLIMVSVASYFYMHQIDKPEASYTKQVDDIAPGGNKAILTLADGRKISLTDARSGELAEQSGISITKTADGQLIYKISEPDVNVSGSQYNTIETPNGGQYQVVLPDGSKVWLNAASSLKYPVSFASVDQRKVELKGEAYFEIAKDEKHPFIVKTDQQQIEVLGTHFNVFAYPEESAVKTTLIEGSVKVNGTRGGTFTPESEVRLRPGQQSIVDLGGIKVVNVDTDEAVAWKSGYFRFDDENLESIMRKISRWYDVDITWTDQAVKNETFAAVTTRFANVSRLLNMLEQTGDVKFEVDGRKISIRKKSK